MNKIKIFCVLLLLLLGASFISAQTITRCGGPTNALSINWRMFHFDVCHTGNNPYEHSLSPSTVGNLVQAWWYPISAFTDKSITSSPALSNGVLYVVSPDGPLFAVNASTGNLIWQKAISAVGNVAIVNGVLYVGSIYNGIGHLYALDATTGNVIWQYAAPFSVGSPAVADGIVYVQLYTSLYALDAHSGAVIWHQPTSPSSASPAVVNGIVYVGTDRGSIFGLNARTGAIIWGTTAVGYISSSPTVANGVIYVGCNDLQHRAAALYALNALTGGVIWKYGMMDLDVLSDASPAVANGIVYVSTDSTLWALDAAAGTLHWTFSKAYGYGQSAPAVANGVVYLGSAGTDFVRSLFALDAGTGALLWQYDFQTKQSNLSSPAVANGVLYTGTGDGYLFAFHLPDQ